jgi:HD superfamily phosphodiesterase
MINFDYKPFLLKDHYFDHSSTLHGINHTYRVMFHVLNIGRKAGLNHDIRLAFCAAFIHDMARLHDSYCTEHGIRSVKRKLPAFKQLFFQTGIDADGIRAIKLAVANHSIRHEISKSNPYYHTVALLKDADALDRIRIGEHNLKIKYLRYPETVELVDFAKELYYRSDGQIIRNMDELIDLAVGLGEKPF